MNFAQKAENWLLSTWHVKVPLPWLEACIEWIQQESQGVSLTQAQINKQVFEQWLLTDLRDLACPVLPEGISEALKSELNGFYCLQIDSLIDVSQPAYAQLQKLRGRDNPNEQVTATTQVSQKPWEAKPTRMLMLQLTDGVQELQGMEYQPIPFFHTGLSPGAKMILHGNVTCRLGVLLLKSENVKVLGGEVEALTEEYSQERVLARLIGEPENAPVVRPNNQTFNTENGADELGQALGPSDEELLASLVEDDGFRMNNETDSGYGIQSNTVTAASVSLSSMPDSRSQSFDSLILETGEEQPVREDNPTLSDSDMDFDDFPVDEIDDFPVDEIDNEIFLQQELEESLVNPKENCSISQEATTENRAPLSKCNKDNVSLPFINCNSVFSSQENIHNGKSFDIIPQRRDGPFGRGLSDQNERVLTRVSSLQTTQISQNPLGDTERRNNVGRTSGNSSSIRIRPVVKCQPFDNRPFETESIRCERISESGDVSGTSLAFSRATERSECLAGTTFDVDSSFTYLSIVLSNPESVRVVKVKAFIVTLLANLANNSGMWRIQAKISDGSAYLDVELADEILTNLIGFSVAEMNFKRNPGQREQLIAGLQRCQRELIDLCCLMTIRFNHSKSKAVVLALHDMDVKNLQYLEKRRRSCSNITPAVGNSESITEDAADLSAAAPLPENSIQLPRSLFQNCTFMGNVQININAD